MSGKNEKDYEKDYTKPALRARLKEEIKKSTEGGKAGQWSARKSQLLNKMYQDQGGDFVHRGSKTDSQKNIIKWSKEQNKPSQIK